MRSSFTFFLFVISIIAVNSQLNGTWVYAWQNAPANACVPANFTISSNPSSQYTIDYTYPSSVISLCTNTTPIVTSTLTQQGSSESVWNDTYGQLYTLNGNSLSFSLANQSISYIFQPPGTGIQQPLTIGTLGGYWNSPTSTSSTAGCCVPDLLFLTPSSSQSTPGNMVYSSFFITSSCASNVTNQTLNLWESTASAINWVDSTASPTIEFNYVSTAATTLTVTLVPSNNTCIYTYQRSYNYTPVTGTWKLDWQTASPNYPATYTVTNNANATSGISYMSSYFTENQESDDSYLVQTQQGLYYDSLMQQTFTYNSPSNTLFSTSQNLLYSPTGSLFESNPFVQLWGTPVTNAGATYQSCCFPYLINITNNNYNNNTLNVLYHFYKESSPACQEFTMEIDDDTHVMTSLLTVTEPSFVQLTWNDTLGNQITFANSSTTAQILTTFPVNQCSFTMVVTTEAPVDPQPEVSLQSMKMSTKAIGFIVCLLAAFAWI